MKFFNASTWKNFIQFNYQEAAAKKCFYRDHLEISASAFRHQHRHWYQHCHRHCKKVVFAFRSFFEKIKYLYFFLCLAMSSAPLCYKYLFLYDFLFTQPKVLIGALEKAVLTFRSIRPLVFWKNNCSKNFCILPSKTSRVDSFLNKLGGLSGIFLKSYLEQLFCREPVNQEAADLITFTDEIFNGKLHFLCSEKSEQKWLNWPNCDLVLNQWFGDGASK